MKKVIYIAYIELLKNNINLKVWLKKYDISKKRFGGCFGRVPAASPMNRNLKFLVPYIK